MIFEHEETGIQVAIAMTEETDSDYGVAISRSMATESGQPCEPWSTDDHHELRQIALWTRTGRIQMTRVS